MRAFFLPMSCIPTLEPTLPAIQAPLQAVCSLQIQPPSVGLLRFQTLGGLKSQPPDGRRLYPQAKQFGKRFPNPNMALHCKDCHGLRSGLFVQASYLCVLGEPRTDNIDSAFEGLFQTDSIGCRSGGKSDAGLIVNSDCASVVCFVTGYVRLGKATVSVRGWLQGSPQGNVFVGFDFEAMFKRCDC